MSFSREMRARPYLSLHRPRLTDPGELVHRNPLPAYCHPRPAHHHPHRLMSAPVCARVFCCTHNTWLHHSLYRGEQGHILACSHPLLPHEIRIVDVRTKQHCCGGGYLYREGQKLRKMTSLVWMLTPTTRRGAGCKQTHCVFSNSK